MLQVLTVMVMGRLAAAIAFPAPDPTITAAPLAKRIITTAGYRSTGFQDGSTLWGTVTYNLQGQTISTRGDQFRICNTASACNFFTCSGAYAYYSGTSTYCGASSSLTCSSDVSYTDLADKSPLTNYWCDEATLDGWAIYAATTGGDTLPASTRPSTTTTTSTSSSSSSVSNNGDSSPSPTPPTPGPITEDKKSTPIGAIVGGVVGGLVVIGLIVVGVIFALKKKKKPTPATPAMATAPATYQPPPPANYTQPAYYPPQPQQQSPPMGYSQHNSMVGGFVPSPEKTPAVTANAAPYYVNTDSGPTSPVPQYSAHNGAVNELPAQRM